jgi:hypothetical protein
MKNLAIADDDRRANNGGRPLLMQVAVLMTWARQHRVWFKQDAGDHRHLMLVIVAQARTTLRQYRALRRAGRLCATDLAVEPTMRLHADAGMGRSRLPWQEAS